MTEITPKSSSGSTPLAKAQREAFEVNMIEKGYQLQAERQYGNATTLSKAYSDKYSIGPHTLHKTMKRRGVIAYVMSAQPVTPFKLILNPYSVGFPQNMAKTQSGICA